MVNLVLVIFLSFSILIHSLLSSSSWKLNFFESRIQRFYENAKPTQSFLREYEKDKENIKFDSSTDSSIFESSIDLNLSSKKGLEKMHTQELINQFSKYFVPGFVLFWAISYSLLAYYETASGSGLGNLGGTIGVSLIGVLFFSLLTILIVEVMKPDEQL